MKISCDDDSEKPPMASPELNLINNAKLEAFSHPVQVIAITGGKGGVGKTSVSVNLATAMAAAGKRVVLLDGDLGLANADVFLGLSPRYTLAHVLSGERTLDEVVIAAPQGTELSMLRPPTQ
jgi:MinD-like ATPase involved in chromosome partitioning or flagellar assembly